MLTSIARGILFRLLGYSVLLLGFWLLLAAFQRPSIPLGILGAVLIPAGMYSIVFARRASGPGDTQASDQDRPGEDVDSVD